MIQSSNPKQKYQHHRGVERKPDPLLVDQQHKQKAPLLVTVPDVIDEAIPPLGSTIQMSDSTEPQSVEQEGEREVLPTQPDSHTLTPEKISETLGVRDQLEGDVAVNFSRTSSNDMEVSAGIDGDKVEQAELGKTVEPRTLETEQTEQAVQVCVHMCCLDSVFHIRMLLIMAM